MKPWVAVLVALGCMAALVRSKGAGVASKQKNFPEKRQSDVGLLVPAFADRVVTLVERMRARGFDAIVWETLRSKERAARLAEVGAGIVDSMHCYGLAADIISESMAWNAQPAFWQGLGEEAERLGVVWGGRFSRRDFPHVQAVAVSEQRAFRLMDAEQRQRVLEARFS